MAELTQTLPPERSEPARLIAMLAGDNDAVKLGPLRATWWMGMLTLRVPSAYIRSDRATPEGCRRTSGSSLATLPNR